MAKTRSYVLTPLASQDLKDIWKYNKRNWGEAQAIRYTNLIRSTLEDLCIHPEKGRQLENLADGLKYQKSGKHLLFYFTNMAQIQVVRMLHEQMDHSRHLEKL